MPVIPVEKLMSEKKDYTLKEIIIYVLLMSIVSGGAGTIVGTSRTVSEDRIIALEERVGKMESAQEQMSRIQTETLVILGEIRTDIRHMSARLEGSRSED